MDCALISLIGMTARKLDGRWQKRCQSEALPAGPRSVMHASCASPMYVSTCTGTRVQIKPLVAKPLGFGELMQQLYTVRSSALKQKVIDSFL